MKKAFFTLLFFCFALSLFSQGISIQGIARDNNDSAITDTNLTFTFSITEDNNTVVFAETQSIKTDNFGVFSHIISTGNPITNAFNDIDFSVQNLKVKVLINYNSNDITVYDQTLQSTPYAHFSKRSTIADFSKRSTISDNGVPTGAIMPFIGDKNSVPEGWLLCDGASITINASTDKLRTLLGDTNTPNLTGRFLKGSGTPSEAHVNTIGLKGYQNQSTRTKNHLHSNNLSVDWNHALNNSTRKVPASSSWRDVILRSGETSGDSFGLPRRESGENLYGVDTNHKHSMSGSVNGITATDNSEVRPSSFGVNYIIKL
jgi:microcystin-dependent protein